MKTLLVTNCKHGASWLNTQEQFAAEFKGNPETIDAVKALAPGKTLHFDVAGDRLIDPRVPFKVFRISNEQLPPPDLADYTGALLALSVFLYGIVAVAS